MPPWRVNKLSSDEFNEAKEAFIGDKSTDDVVEFTTKRKIVLALLLCVSMLLPSETSYWASEVNESGATTREIIYDSKDNLEKKITQFILPFNEEIIKAKNIESSNNDADIYPEIWRLQEIYVNKIMELKRKYKHPAYIYEKEFRLKISLPDYNRNNKDLTNYNVSKGGIFIEYFKLFNI